MYECIESVLQIQVRLFRLISVIPDKWHISVLVTYIHRRRHDLISLFHPLSLSPALILTICCFSFMVLVTWAGKYQIIYSMMGLEVGVCSNHIAADVSHEPLAPSISNFFLNCNIIPWQSNCKTRTLSSSLQTCKLCVFGLLNLCYFRCFR